MFNVTISSLSNVDVIYLLAALITIIVGVIGLFKVFLPYLRSKKEFSDLFLYCKAKDLQQEDFGIQPPSDANANAEAYWRRESDGTIEKSLRSTKNVLVLGMPKMGKTRSVYQALKAALPDFYVIRVPPRKVEELRFPFLKKNYLVFFDDLNEFVKVNFDFDRHIKEFKKRSRTLIVVATCRSGDEYSEVKENAMQTLREFPNVVNLDDYVMDERDGEALAGEANVPWRPEQFLGTPGSVVLDIEDMKNRYRSASDHEKCVLRSCKLLKRANIFVYKKELIQAICETVFETPVNETSWLKALNHLSENSLVTMASIPRIEVYDPTLETIVYDYDPVYHLESLLTLLIALEDAENLFYLAYTFYRDGNYEKAERSYKECLRFNPNLAEPHNNLGVLLKNLTRYKEAEDEYRSALRIKPNYAEAHNNLGNLLKDLKRFEEAEVEYREALRLKPDYVEAHCNLGILLKDLKRYNEAEGEYRDTLRLKPDYVEAHNELGIAHRNLKRFEEAEEEYREALRLKPDYAEAHNNLGILFEDLKRFEEAEGEYREALKINSDFAEAQYNLGGLLKKLERHPEAETEYKEAIRINPDYADAHYNLGNLFMSLNRFEEAEKEYKEAIRIKPDYAKAHYTLGYLFMDLNLLEEAKKELETARRLFEAQGRAEDVQKAEKLLKSL